MNLNQALNTQQVAELVGVVPRTITTYLSKGMMPPADGYVYGGPLWKRSTIRAWLSARPGRGAGGGRPAHRSNRVGLTV